MKAAFIEPSARVRQSECMQRLHALLAGLGLSAALLGLPAAAAQQTTPTAPTVVNFDRTPPGQRPAGFAVLSSSDQEPGRWQVVRVGKVVALGQLDIGQQGYRLAVHEAVSLEHVHVGVRLRVDQGDRAAGVAWRIQDEANYYAARLDFDSREVVLYKFVRGNRVRLARLTGIRLDPGAWHELAVDHVGTRIRVWLNGVPVASEQDTTLQRPGRVGFWMPGDGSAHFERLWYRPLEIDQ
jgi:hypothetical protein